MGHHGPRVIGSGARPPIDYLFVDGAALDSVIARCSNICRTQGITDSAITFDYNAFFMKYHRIFYYDALPAKKHTQSDDEYKTTCAQKEQFLDQLSRIPNTHVRCGFSKYRKHRRNNMDTERGVLEQKGVDVLLAVDITTFAYSGNMDIATIVTNDLDLFPVFDALLMTPVRTTLIYDPRAASGDLKRIPVILKHSQHA